MNLSFLQSRKYRTGRQNHRTRGKFSVHVTCLTHASAVIIAPSAACVAETESRFTSAKFHHVTSSIYFRSWQYCGQWHGYQLFPVILLRLMELFQNLDKLFMSKFRVNRLEEVIQLYFHFSILPREIVSASKHWPAGSTLLFWLFFCCYCFLAYFQSENEKLSAELHASVDQNTQMYEKVLVVSNSLTLFFDFEVFNVSFYRQSETSQFFSLRGI